MDTIEILKHFDSAKPKSGAPNKLLLVIGP